MSIRNRLDLAYKLALAILQLYSSPWISNNWCSQDIVLLKTRLSCHEEDDKDEWLPYVGAAFDHLGEMKTMSVCNNKDLRSSYITSLGVVQLEIGLSKPLKLKPQYEGSDLKRWLEACTQTRLATVAVSMSNDYHKVIERCVFWSTQEIDLENENIQRMSYEEVVSELQNCILEYDRRYGVS